MADEAWDARLTQTWVQPGEMVRQQLRSTIDVYLTRA
jgi:hypothetical protein